MVGDREGCSIEEMIKAYHELPEDGISMQYITKLWFVRSIVQYQIKDYINWSTEEVNFNSDNFIKLIEVAGKFLDKEENSAHSQESTSVLVKICSIFGFCWNAS